MRTTTSSRLLVLTLALLAAGCEDSSSPLEPAIADEGAPVQEASAFLATPRWADAYLTMTQPALASYTPSRIDSYNRGGGGINVRRPSGTTGRYVVTFSRLSSVLGSKSTVHVTGLGFIDDTFCKPVNGIVVSDKVEVRCFLAATGAPANAASSLVVLGKAAGRAFAYAHQPTSSNYSPNGQGSWNPAGSSRVTRHGPGLYLVTFNNLASKLQGRGGHVQVNAVSSGKAHCKAAENWGGSPNVGVTVQCYSPTGAPVDAKFTALFQLPAARLAYAYADQSTNENYSPSAFWSSNPTGGAIWVNRLDDGQYIVGWNSVDSTIIDAGNLQVTAVGENVYAHYKLAYTGPTVAAVRCFAPNGTPVNTNFTVMLGS